MVTRKKRYSIKDGTLFAPPKKPNAILNCPVTGVTVLYQFPACADFAGGPIYLREGKHTGPHQGFGFQHIWKERFPDKTARDQAEAQVFTAVRGVLIQGASIHHEGGTGRDSNRASISIRSPVGLVIVEERTDSANAFVYNVVTYIRTGPKGILIGELL